MVFRTYVEKRQGLAPECEALLTDCRDFLGVQGLRAARIWNRYDVEGIEAPLFENACRSVFSEPPLDLVSDAADTQDACAVFAVEPLPGQFDQRADSASQCIQLLSQGERPRIRTAKVYALYGMLTDADVEAVKRYVINPSKAARRALQSPKRSPRSLPSRSAFRPSRASPPWTRPGSPHCSPLWGLPWILPTSRRCKTISARPSAATPL